VAPAVQNVSSNLQLGMWKTNKMEQKKNSVWYFFAVRILALFNLIPWTVSRYERISPGRSHAVAACVPYGRHRGRPNGASTVRGEGPILQRVGPVSTPPPVPPPRTASLPAAKDALTFLNPRTEMQT
jgi:hypothetical protein